MEEFSAAAKRENENRLSFSRLQLPPEMFRSCNYAVQKHSWNKSLISNVTEKQQKKDEVMDKHQNYNDDVSTRETHLEDFCLTPLQLKFYKQKSGAHIKASISLNNRSCKQITNAINKYM